MAMSVGLKVKLLNFEDMATKSMTSLLFMNLAPSGK